MGRGYLLVEGHGETEAVGNLVYRLTEFLGLPYIQWVDPIRQPNIHLKKGVVLGCERIRRKGDVDALLILRDEDDHCPKVVAPEAAGWIRHLDLPFPVAFVVLHREYETLFLPSLETMAGKELVYPPGTPPRAGLMAGTRFEGDPQSIRGVKEWISRRFPAGKRYKPTLDQLPMTRLVDFSLLSDSSLPCFGTLTRAVRFLVANRGQDGHVYPPPATSLV